MENASKALLIAGSILLAVLIISMLLLGYGKIRDISRADDEKNHLKQINAFNAEYESYNRKLLHGVDVISVVNKAINNNEKQAQKVRDPWYINIVIEINSPDGGYYIYGDKVEGGRKNHKEKDDIISEINEALRSKGNELVLATDDDIKNQLNKEIDNLELVKQLAASELKNGTYQLIDGFNINGLNQKIKLDDTTLLNTFGNSSSEIEIEINGTTFKIYSPVKSFKSAIFTCEEVKYNDEGRISEMTFKMEE